MNPNDPMLVDRTNILTVATTDPTSRTIYISKSIHGGFLARVLIHELGHCAMVSFNLIDDIHRMAYPEYWIEAEEWVCNFIADYGLTIFKIAYDALGDKSLEIVPYEIERLISSRR